jgi:hypothetical protein
MSTIPSKEFVGLYIDRVEALVGTQPQLELLWSFLKDERWGNNACRDRRSLLKDVKVLGHTSAGWVSEVQNPECASLQPVDKADRHAIVLNYLDSHLVAMLGVMFEIDPEFFYSHLAGCEQHFTGEWHPSRLTAAAPLLSTRLQAPFFVIDFRRLYACDASDDDLDRLREYDDQRIQTCSILRSFHVTSFSTKIFGHERFSVVRIGSNINPPWGPTGTASHVASQEFLLIQVGE